MTTTQGEVYSYDRYGNRAVTTRNAPLPSLTLETATSLSQFVGTTNRRGTSTSYAYDSRGNVTDMATRTATYDAENHQITVTPAVPTPPTYNYFYDGEGRRVKKTVSATTTIFVYDAMGNLAAEYGGTNADTGRRFVTVDHLGSTRYVTGDVGVTPKIYDYLPFGEELGTACLAADNGVKFTGKYRDKESCEDDSRLEC